MGLLPAGNAGAALHVAGNINLFLYFPLPPCFCFFLTLFYYLLSFYHQKNCQHLNNLLSIGSLKCLTVHKGQSNLIYPEDHQVDRDQVDRAHHRDNRSEQKHNPDNQAQDVQEQVEEEIPAVR